MEWEPVKKPAEVAESRILDGILQGRFPVNQNLPAERELAEQVGVTRPTLREALQRLERDGWLEIRHGKATRVRDYWREGGLSILAKLAENAAGQVPEFITNLLEFRVLIAPAYTRQAIEGQPETVAAYLEGIHNLEDDKHTYATADWGLHKLLTQLAPNPIFRFLANGFEGLSIPIGEEYFSHKTCRLHSENYYNELMYCAQSRAAFDGENLTRRIMEESLALWIDLKQKTIEQ
jgi:GntR family negative regulator for fad regulon and positive regulator of fabA